ncbi:hypothetical protein GGR54DRAFT_269185 [Hypoxylon sp. NC1633]|nr:hypothetical protein GGR54DRAFT_269185 [Hypoxylon sp. NC1633]
MEEIGKDFDILLLPEGDAADAELRARKPEFRQAAEQTHYGDRLFTKANVVGVTHGTLSPGGSPATLLILEFRFISMQQGRRFTNAKVTVKFEDSDGDIDSTPEPFRVVPEGAYALRRTECQRTVKIVGNANLNATFAGSGASIGLLWEREQNETPEDWAQLTGTKYQTSSYDKDDAVIWYLQENSTIKSGIPTLLRTAVLLRRTVDDAPFNVTIDVRAKVDFSLSQAVSDIRGLFGKTKVVRVPPRPLGIDTAIDPKLLNVATADPKSVDLESLDDLEIGQFADVVLITLL